MLFGHGGHVACGIKPRHTGFGLFIDIEAPHAVPAAYLGFSGPELDLPFPKIDSPASKEPFLNRALGGKQNALDLFDDLGFQVVQLDPKWTESFFIGIIHTAQVGAFIFHNNIVEYIQYPPAPGNGNRQKR